ncbi:MAG: alkaline phosphatase D family protein, partial [Planctomycetota bacterium]
MCLRRSSLCATLVILMAFSCAAPAVRSDGLFSGPMLGDLRADSVRIWAGGKRPGTYSIEVARADAIHRWAPAVDADGDPAVIRMSGARLYGQCRIVGLDPDTEYRYRLVLEGRPQHGPSDQQFRTLPTGDEPFSFRVAFGSCAGDWGIDPEQPVFRAIHAMDPDLFLWLGDNVYFSLQEEEWEDPTLMESRWRTQRAMPSLQPLLADTPHYAIWDDHDFGPNDSDGTYPLRDFSLDLFTSYWPNPAAGLDGPDGVFFRFDVGKVAFFMLDTRFDRAPNSTDDGVPKPLLSG